MSSLYTNSSSSINNGAMTLLIPLYLFIVVLSITIFACIEYLEQRSNRRQRLILPIVQPLLPVFRDSEFRNSRRRG